MDPFSRTHERKDQALPAASSQGASRALDLSGAVGAGLTTGSNDDGGHRSAPVVAAAIHAFVYDNGSVNRVR